MSDTRAKACERRELAFQEFDKLSTEQQTNIAMELSERLGPSVPSSSSRMVKLSREEQILVAIAVDDWMQAQGAKLG